MSRSPELTLPLGGTSAARRRVGDALSRLVRDVSRISVSARSGPRAEDVRTVLARVAPLARTVPGVVWSCLRRPSVYVHLRLAADAASSSESLPWLSTGLATLAVELAAAGALDSPLRLLAPPARIVVRSRGVAVRVEPGRELTLDPDGASRQGATRCAETPSHVPVSGAIALALVDDNPLASFEAHPDKSGNALSLGDADGDAWARSLHDALGRIERALPTVRDELELVLSQIVPVGTDAERHLSASYREALGTIYVSLHPDPLTMTEALLHEAQHNKLNAVLTLDPLLENAPEERYASPVRPDPRPLLGVLLAVHAFVPVAILYAELAARGDPAVQGPRVAARVETILRGNAEGLAMLEAHARPTPLGRELLGELSALHDESRRRLTAR